MPEMKRSARPTPARKPRCRLGSSWAWVALAALRPALAAQPGADLTALSLENLLQLSVGGASEYAQRQNEVAAAVNVITRREIQAFGWRTLAEALASLPGVHISYDRQYANVGMRGLGLPGDLTARLLVTLNGNRINDPVYDAGPAGRELPIDLDLVDRIEFIPGPGGAVHGDNAMFGVVNIVTGSGSDLAGGELALASQPAQRQHEARASWGRRLGQGTDLLLSVSSLRARGADRFYGFGAAGVSGVAAGLDGERVDQFVAQAVHGAWSADWVQGARRKDDPTAAFFTDPLVAGQFSRDAYTLAQVQYQGPLEGENLQLSARWFAGRYRFEGQFRYLVHPGQRPLRPRDRRAARQTGRWPQHCAHGLPYALALLDMHRPGMDGLQLARRIQAEPALARTRLMMLSSTYAHADAASRAQAGLSWQLAGNGAEALARVGETDFDLVLMDCRMPVMDGYQATAAIRGLAGGSGRRLPIVALTANALQGDQQACLDAGMDDFLAKPYTLAALHALLARWLPRSAGPLAPAGATRPVPTPALADPAGPALNQATLAALRELEEPGSRDLITELVGSFLQSADANLARIGTALAGRQAKALAQAAHALKSSPANLGALALAACYRELETWGREGRIDDAQRLLAPTRREQERALRALRELLTDTA